MTDQERISFEDEIAAIAAGESEAIENHIDKLAEDDDARDLRHEVTEIAERITASGDEYVHPSSFKDDLLALVDSEDTVSESIPKAETKSETIAKTDKEPEKIQAVKPSGSPANENRSPLLWVGGGAAAAFLLVMGGMQLGSGSSSSESTSGPIASAALLTAEITQLDRSSQDGRSGISVIRSGQKDSQPLEVGGRLAAGDVVSTDARSRIILSMSDDSKITLAANSTMLFDAEKTRTIALQAGELVAEVAHHENGPNAFYNLPNGQVEVLGTKFSLSADGEYSNVRVAHGVVSLQGKGGKSVKVHAGEEGILNKSAAPTVSPALYVSDSMRWSELGPEAEEDRGGSGLGELRAYKPGQSRDTDWPMALQSHKVTVRVVGNVARTEIEEIFRNDSKTVLEGVYTFPLPAGAQIDKLALDVDGKFEEGAIVEKGRAAKIWKGVIAKATNKKPKRPAEIIWVPGPWKDPALLEWKEGNRFQLRIFPIPKEGTRTIKLAYTQVIEPQGDRRRYTYPLPRSEDGSSVAEHFAFNLRLGSAEPDSLVRTPGYEMKREQGKKGLHFQFDNEAFVPNGDVVVDYRAKGQSSELQAWGFQGAAATPPSMGYRGKKRSPRKEVLAEQIRVAADTKAYALMALRPRLPRWTEQKNRDFVIVVDSSQSMVGNRFDRATRAASELISGLSPRDRAIVMACDLECKTFDKQALRPSAENARAVQAWLGKISPAGASFMESNLEFAASSTKLFDQSSDKRERVIVYIGDGVASMGHRSLAVLGDTARELRAQYNTSFTTVAIGADSDSRALGSIATAGGGYFIGYKPGRKPSHMAEAVLETTTGVALRDAEVTFPSGMVATSPLKLGTLRAGAEILLTGRYESEIDGEIVLKGTVGGKPFKNSYPLRMKLQANAGNAFVPKIWASQTIQRLESESQAAIAIPLSRFRKPTASCLSKLHYWCLSPRRCLRPSVLIGQRLCRNGRAKRVRRSHPSLWATKTSACWRLPISLAGCSPT
ncbi:MAG: FecR domain-containing protein [Kofleriaceae bacterium]|nr:FecR domain-containing protein [Kofleriaceae bacterium]